MQGSTRQGDPNVTDLGHIFYKYQRVSPLATTTGVGEGRSNAGENSKK